MTRCGSGVCNAAAEITLNFAMCEEQFLVYRDRAASTPSVTAPPPKNMTCGSLASDAIETAN